MIIGSVFLTFVKEVAFSLALVAQLEVQLEFDMLL